MSKKTYFAWKKLKLENELLKIKNAELESLLAKPKKKTTALPSKSTLVKFYKTSANDTKATVGTTSLIPFMDLTKLPVKTKIRLVIETLNGKRQAMMFHTSRQTSTGRCPTLYGNNRWPATRTTHPVLKVHHPVFMKVLSVKVVS